MGVNRGIMPSKEVCGNCHNWEPLNPCEPYRRQMRCGSFEPLDPGDVEVEEEQPYQWETALGSADVKGGRSSIVPPIEEVDVDGAEEEEAEGGG